MWSQSTNNSNWADLLPGLVGVDAWIFNLANPTGATGYGPTWDRNDRNGDQKMGAKRMEIGK
jgi:hypothetical protein